MENRIFVRLKIVSEKIISEEIDALVGLKSSRSWKIGDYRGKTKIKENNNGWVLNSGLGEEESLESHIESLLKLLEPKADLIRKISDENMVEFSCAIYSKETPALNFDRSVIGQISALGASLDVDLYLI